MKRFTFYIITFCICLLVVIFPVRVEAKEPLKTEKAVSLSGEEVGSIILYDDYTIVFEHLYRVNNIEITVCKKDFCDGVEPQIVSTNTYINQEIVEFSLNDLLVREENVSYVIKATGHFKPTSGAITSITTTLNHVIELSDESTSDDKSNKILMSLDNVKAFCNQWIIPIIYIVLAVTFVIKAILLCIDLIKYSDNHEVRSEKLRAFIYLFVALLVIALINSSVGYITGLFG